MAVEGIFIRNLWWKEGEIDRHCLIERKKMKRKCNFLIVGLRIMVSQPSLMANTIDAKINNEINFKLEYDWCQVSSSHFNKEGILSRS